MRRRGVSSDAGSPKLPEPGQWTAGGVQQMQTIHPRRSTRFAARSIPLLLAALLASLASVAAQVVPPAGDTAPPCEDSASDGVGLFSSPLVPQPDGVLRAIAVSERRFTGTLVVLDPDGQPASATTERRGGPPYWWYVDVVPHEAGDYRAILRHGTRMLACRTIHVGPSGTDERDAGNGVWPIAGDWSRATENLYSAWIEKLFDDPLDAEPAWRALHEVTRDPQRNFLHDHLGLGEDDDHGLRLEPDCADLPYFLRAYFAWKLGLPFGYSECTRGDGGKPPRCSRWHSSLDVSGAHGAPLERMQAFIEREVGPAAQSGAGRAPGDDDRTDFYPTSLTRETLRPGTVYADPYGHVLVVVGRVPQTGTTGGLLLAVDGQPDHTVARKRYWRGNFLFVHDPSLGSAGFKHFRPVVRTDEGLRPLDNAEIGKDPRYGDLDLEQDESRDRGVLRSRRCRAVAAPAGSGACSPRDPRRPRRAGPRAGALGRERRGVREQASRYGSHAGGRGRVRDLRSVGGLRDAGARSAPADRDRRRPLVSREGGESARTLRASAGPGARGGAGGARVTGRRMSCRLAASSTRAAMARPGRCRSP